MENNGWTFDTNYDEPDDYKSSCDMQNTWYGFKYPGVGTVTSTFTGSGTATLDYGNCHTKGDVNVYLNGELKDVASMNTPSKQITLNFSPNDVLLLSETGETIIKLNSLSLNCNNGKTFFRCIKVPIVLVYTRSSEIYNIFKMHDNMNV